MASIIILAFFGVFVIFPVCSLFMRITPSGIVDVINLPQFYEALKNSLICSGTAALISLCLALVCAMCIERTRIKHKAFFNLLFVMPMLIPSISHAFGLVALFGANGLITKIFGLNGSIYGFTGIIAGSVMYSFPVAYIMLADILRYEDGTQHKAAEVLGVPSHRRFLDLTLPFLKRPLISAFFAAFTMIITDYGVPLMIGGKTITLPVLMYNRAIGMIDYNSGSVIGALLLLPAVAAFVIDLLNSENRNNNFMPEPVTTKEGKFARTCSLIFCVVISIAIFAPVIAFCMMTFAKKYPVDASFTLYHVLKTIRRGAGNYLLNSILYAFFAGIAGTSLAFVCSYITARLERYKFSRIIHLISLLTMAVPGIVLGLSFVIFFNRTSLYGTILIIIIANTVHFFASPYLMMYNALRKINPSLEDTGSVLGVNRLNIIADVIMPEVMPAVKEMFAYFFVNSMMTVSAVSFLAPPSPRPVALMIPQFEAQLLMESAAFISLVILVVNSLLKLFLREK